MKESATVPTTRRTHAPTGTTVPDSPRSRSPLGPRASRGVSQTHVQRSPITATSTKAAAPTYARPGLSEREITVLRAWLDCDSKLGVATRLHIALGTVNTHLTRIRDKYSTVGRPAPTKAALVARALQDGIVTLDDL